MTLTRAAASAKTGTLSAVLIVRNEERHLKEWLEFHRIVGVEHIYVYENGSSDGTWKLLEQFRDQGFVTLVPWAGPVAPGVPTQRLAYWHALNNFGSGWRWMTFIDSDEFLFPTHGFDLRKTLEPYEDLPGLVAFWSMFGTAGHQQPPDGPVIRNYTLRAPFPSATNTKSIVDPRQVPWIGSVHRIGAKLYDEQRRPFDDVDLAPIRGLDGSSPSGPYRPTNDVFRLHHYYTRSQSELDLKYSTLLAAGTVTPATTKMLRIAELIEKEPVEDTSAWRFLPELERRLGLAEEQR